MTRSLGGSLTLLGVVAGGLAGQQDSSALDQAPKAYRNRIIGLPYVSYSPQTKFEFGVAGGYQFKWPGMSRSEPTRPSWMAANVSYTTKNQWTTFVGTSLFSPHSRWWVTGSVSAGFFPLFYYGIGPHTDEADSNLMEHKFLRFDAKVLRRVKGPLYAGPYYRRHSAFSLDWQFPARIPSSLPGGDGGVSSGLGATVLLDGRNSQTTPTHGYYLQVDYLRHAQALGSDFSYSHVALDARAYLPIPGRRDVLALSLYGETNGRDVPIQSMALLSNVTSLNIMRGVYLGRFRDRNELVAQVDYRGHLKGRFGYVVFGSTGNVYGSRGNGAFDDLKFTYGAGLRFDVNPADPLNVWLDVTGTDFGGGGIVLGASEPF